MEKLTVWKTGQYGQEVEVECKFSLGQRVKFMHPWERKMVVAVVSGAAWEDGYMTYVFEDQDCWQYEDQLTAASKYDC